MSLQRNLKLVKNGLYQQCASFISIILHVMIWFHGCIVIVFDIGPFDIYADTENMLLLTNMKQRSLENVYYCTT